MNLLKNITIGFVLLTFNTMVYSEGYKIEIKVKGIKDSIIILGHHLASSLIPDDTVRADKNGYAVFKGKKILPQGMYIVFLPTKNYFDVIVGENQKFSVENDTSDLFKKIKFSGSKENQIFYDYQYFLSDKRDVIKKLQEDRKNAKTDAEKNKITEQMKTVDKEVRSLRDKITSENGNLFVAKFIKATQDIDVPEPPKDAKENITDSFFQYHYYRNHYFDNIDISDSRMLRTPIYEEKILTFIDKVIPQTPDSIYPIIDMYIAKSRTSPELFRYMLTTLFNHYGQSQIMGFDAIALYIADKYYIKEATWADTASIRKLKDQVIKRMPLNIGKVAPDIRLVFVSQEHFKQAKDSLPMKKDPYVGGFFNLTDIKSDFMILYFWEADCGHCKKATPQLYDIFTKKLKTKNITVVAINLLGGEEGKVKWIDFVNEHQCYGNMTWDDFSNKHILYGWINAWNPYDYKFKELYDVVTTPSIYILDRSYKIIAKRIGPEQCEEIIDHFIDMDKRKKK
jgi:hypothetical protein